MLRLELPQEFPFDDPSLPYCIELMQSSDLDQVMPIERVAFPAPWPASAYRYELTQNDLSTYLVLRLRHSRSPTGWQKVTRLWREDSLPLLGYGGFWMIVDEAHISTIAVHPEWRGRGLGEMTLVSLIDGALLRGAAEVTLEARVSNAVARNLYRKYGFVEVGRRKRYYHDNSEDALIMTTPRIDSADFMSRYVGLKTTLRDRLLRSRVEREKR